MGGNEIVEICHECKYEKRWDSFFIWKEKVIDFMAEKRTTNGNLTLEDKKLEKRLTSIESKMWGLLISILGFAVSVIIAMLALIRFH